MKDHLSQIDLYVTLDDPGLQGLLEAIDLDEVVQRSLRAAHVEQAVMLTVMLTDDATIQDMNQQFREQNKPTDVLSFPLLEQPLVDAPAEELWQPALDESGAPSAPASSPSPFVSPPGQATNLGDIAISWPTVQLQAREAGHSPTYELIYLIIHGVLHLVGYDDQTEAGYQSMVQKQLAVLKDLNVDPRA